MLLQLQVDEMTIMSTVMLQLQVDKMSVIGS